MGDVVVRFGTFESPDQFRGRVDRLADGTFPWRVRNPVDVDGALHPGTWQRFNPDPSSTPRYLSF